MRVRTEAELRFLDFKYSMYTTSPLLTIWKSVQPWQMQSTVTWDNVNFLIFVLQYPTVGNADGGRQEKTL